MGITPREVRGWLDLSNVQRSVLVGTLLGDGCLAKHGRHHRLHVKHKGAHASLVEWKREIFSPFISMQLHRFDQKLGLRRYPCVQFATRTHPVFTEWHRRFYVEGRKTVPGDIRGLLDPVALAVWFMDDGAVDHAGLTFQTHSFTRDEVMVLMEALQERFHLAVNLRRNRGAWVIYVQERSVRLFAEIIGPHLLPEFTYKLNTSTGLEPRRDCTPAPRCQSER